MRILPRVVVAVVVLALGGGVGRVAAEIPQQQVAHALDSGWALNEADVRGVAYATTVHVPGAPWVRLHFDLAELGNAPAGGQPTVLRITSLADGAVQRLDAVEMLRWGRSSAYFNGDTVVLEIVADPGAGPSRVAMSWLMAGAATDGGVATICGPDDDRVPSDEARSGRLLPAQCTTWIIDDANRCFLTAGHCGFQGTPVVQFNVPLSDAEGNMQHPPPEDQYVVDPESVQSQDDGLSNDWAYFGCFPNGQTGLTPFEAQGDYYVLGRVPPEPESHTIRITGYGVDDSPPEWNQIQQTHAGPYVQFIDTLVRYEVDTRGGSSGSAVFLEPDGVAIGIHTHGGCSEVPFPDGGGANAGTSIDHPGLQAALADPQGVCRPTPPVLFEYPEGRPDLLAPNGTVFRVEMHPSENGAPEPGTGLLHYQISVDGLQLPEVTIPLVEISPNVYDVVFPSLECGVLVDYHVSAVSAGGESVTDPITAPDDAFGGLVAAGFDFSFSDDFETDLGWTVSSSGGLSSGMWEHGIPAGGGDRGDPPTDADGSSRCYVTGLADGDTDIDGGSTTLTSPAMDATQGDAHITYYRWYNNSAGVNPAEDVFVVEVSADEGQSWQELETVGPGGPEVLGGWIHKSFRVADFLKPTDAFRIRFTASDLGAGSVVEAGVDGVRLDRSADGLICTCAADVASPPDGMVNVLDLLEVITSWGLSISPADIDGDGDVGVPDLIAVILAWGACCNDGLQELTAPGT